MSEVHGRWTGPTTPAGEVRGGGAPRAGARNG